MGRHHVRNYSEIPTAQLVGVCDLNAQTTEKFAKEYQCPAYTDIDRFLDEAKPDAVSITVPTRFHYETAKKVLTRGIHALIEKPITDTVETAEEIAQLAMTKKAILMVGHIERFNPGVIALKAVIDAGEIGAPVSLISRRVSPFPSQIKDANVIIDLAVHDIDIFSVILGQEPDRVYGNAGKSLNAAREDHAEIFLTYGAKTGFIQVNWITPLRIRTLSVTGTKGYLELNYMTQELILYKSNYSNSTDSFGEPIVKFEPSDKRALTVEKSEPLKNELTHFLECARTGRQPLVSASVGTQALKTALQVIHTIGI